MPTSTSAVALLRDVAQRLAVGRPWPAISTTTALGGTTTLIDSALAYADADTDALQGAWIRIDESVTSGPVTGTVMKVRDGGLTVASGTVTFGPTQLAVQTGTDYSFWWDLHPTLALAILNRVMRLVTKEVLFPVSVFADSDMETSGTTAYSGTTATLSKVTTAVNVRHGASALRVLGNAGVPLAETATSFRTRSAEVWIASAAMQAAVGTANLIAYDKTNSAAISSGLHVQQAYCEIELPQFTIPATCELLTMRFQGVGATDDLYCDDLIAWPVKRNHFDLPSTVEDPNNVIELGYWKRGASVTASTYGYDLDEGDWVQWSYEVKRHEDGAANPFWIEFPTPITRPLFLRARIPFGEFASDTATTTADRELVVGLTLYHIYKHLFGAYQTNHPNTAATANPWYYQMSEARHDNRVRGFLLRHGETPFEIRVPQR